MKKSLFALLFGAALTQAFAAPVNYKLDPTHTYPSFEADHMGVSVWRGKFNSSSGKLTLDRAARTGTFEVDIDTASIDFGLDALNTWAVGKDLLDVATFGPAHYKGKFTGFRGNVPTQTAGMLTLHGVTKPVNMAIDQFKCIPHPMLKRELCGANIVGTFNREDFGLTAGKDYGFKMDVALRIQAEAIAEE